MKIAKLPELLKFLRSMEHVQRAHCSHRDQLKAELARIDDVEGSPVLGLTADAESDKRY